MQHIHVTDSSLDPLQYGNRKESTPLGLGAQAESARLLKDFSVCGARPSSAWYTAKQQKSSSVSGNGLEMEYCVQKS